jgi:DNA-binding transcriptional ArsR family regulator
MLRIHLGAQDLGLIRFATAPAPVLETALSMFELRNRPGRDRRGREWCDRVRSAFPASARPLLWLAPSRHRVLFLDVLTPHADEAFDLVRYTAQAVHADNVARIAQLKLVPVPTWLYRYAEGDSEVLDMLDRALRTFHTSCLAPQWASATARFHDDITFRLDALGRQGITAMLNTLSPDLRLNGLTLEGRYPGEREVYLGGKGMILMPSAFWTGYPLITWDPQEQSRHVLIYPARHGATYRTSSETGDALGALLGPTRAAVLRTLRGQPHTTSGIADYTGISVPSASEHTTTLRESGLIISHRNGRAVRHHLTHLGHTLLRGQDPEAAG